MVTNIEVTRQKVFVMQVLWLLVSVFTFSHAGSDRKIHFIKKIIWHQIVNMSNQDREKGLQFPFDFFSNILLLKFYAGA